MRRVWVVQDRETGLFLCPEGGDVGWTPWLKEAGGFNEEEEAVEAMADHCSEGGDVLSFWTECPIGERW